MENDLFYISSYCKIASNQVNVNGTIVYKDDSELFSDFIKSAYKELDIKYPKFHKMDNLSKLSFLAADVLLRHEGVNPEDERNIAIVFSNKASSLDTDRKHQNSITDASNYFPSPAVFVYTLPNICVGEISIKYKLYSENNFFIFERFNAQHLKAYAEDLLKTKKAEGVLCGWVELDGENYNAYLYLVSRKGANNHDIKTIQKIYTE